MKKLIYISLVFILSLTYGCSDFLDSTPLGFTATSNFYKDANDAEIALTGCYGLYGMSFSVNGRTGMFLIGNVGTDEILGNPYSTPDAGSNMDQFIFGRVLKSNLNIRDIWEKMYTGLYSINELLHQIDGIDMDETRRNEIKAEAMFLRGWHYYHLGMIFGGVPVYTAVPHEIDKGRNTLQEVMTQAITDLSFAYENLENSPLSDPGRASKWSAGGYLARLYCYLASCKKYDVGKNLNFPLNSFDWVNVDDSYNQALVIINDIIDNSGLILTSDYRSLFCEGSASKQKEELLFTYDPSPKSKVGFGLMSYLLPAGTQGGGWGSCRPTQEVLSRYNRNLDLRAGWVVGGLADFDCETQMIDGVAYFKPKDLKLNNGEAWDGDYCVNKFRIEKTESKHEDYYWGLYPLMRLAEIYLLKAEVTAHKSGEEAGREILKVIRERALIETPNSTAEQLHNSYKRDDFIQELLDERSRELCFEQCRKFDLIRFNRYESTIKSLSTTYGVWNRNAALQLIENITDNKIWSPIPEEDEIANPNLKPNNPGY